MRKRMTRTALTALTVLLICLLVVYGALSETASRDRRALNAVYQRAFYETCELMSSLQSNLKKLAVTSDQARQQEILGDIARQAEGTENNLSMLPSGAYTLTATMKFVNQVGDYARALNRALAQGTELTENDKAQLELLAASATELAVQLNEMLSQYNEGTLTFSEYEFAFADAEAAKPFSNPASDYPVLLYDGPFSDGAQSTEMRGLNGEEVSQAQAEAALKDFLSGEISDVVYLGQSGGDVACYEFSFSWQGYRLTAGVTQKGAKLLWMLPAVEKLEERLDVEQCIASAQTFLKIRGFGDVQANDYRQYEGVLTVSFAPIEAGTVLYPDLIKVQVSRQDGTIIGLEMSSYYRNHVSRDLSSPTVSREEAVAGISADLQAQGARLAVIPLNLSEKLCWEVKAKAGEDEYILFIDAFTGAEQAVYQVIHTPEGWLTQ